MARPLRIEHPGGRYHVTTRGNERNAIFRNDRDRTHFLELLAALRERFGVPVHAYVLMENHFHLLLETPEANLSRAMQWLTVSYSMWFNRRHDRSGHLFQGRFKAVLVEQLGGWQEVARYIHLNPVRVTMLGLSKKERAAARQGLGEKPTAQQLAKRLSLLREYRWSSYRAYAGYSPAPEWLEQEPLGKVCGGRSESERQAALREYTEQAVRLGAVESPWNRLVAGMILGSEAFARKLARKARGNAREQGQLRRLRRGASWEEIVRAVEKARGERWEEFYKRHGDWGRDAVLWLGRQVGRLRLREMGELAGGIDYAAVGQAVSRFGKRLEKGKLRPIIMKIKDELSNIEI